LIAFARFRHSRAAAFYYVIGTFLPAKQAALTFGFKIGPQRATERADRSRIESCE
jgi:hypothetical protein